MIFMIVLFVLAGVLLAARKDEQAELNKLKDELLLSFQDQMELRY